MIYFSFVKVKIEIFFENYVTFPISMRLIGVRHFDHGKNDKSKGRKQNLFWCGSSPRTEGYQS